MFQVTLTLPLQQHNGTSNLPVIKSIEYKLAQQYGGYSVTRLSGGWIDEATGDLYEDESLQVWTNVTSEQDVDELLRQAARWAVDLAQLALYVTVSPIKVYEIEGTRAQARSYPRIA